MHEVGIIVKFKCLQINSIYYKTLAVEVTDYKPFMNFLSTLLIDNRRVSILGLACNTNETYLPLEQFLPPCPQLLLPRLL
jgi:hypothetical protein